jgi:hypothetical protein
MQQDIRLRRYLGAMSYNSFSMNFVIASALSSFPFKQQASP